MQPHDEAAADNVNVDFEVYRIRTQITEQDSTIEATPDTVVGVRDCKTRKVHVHHAHEPTCGFAATACP